MNSPPTLKRFWRTLGENEDALSHFDLLEPEDHLPSTYSVSGLADTLVGAALVAVARLAALREGRSGILPVALRSIEASAIFRSEALFKPAGWNLPAPWDPLAGDYQARDGWIRIHTNYAHHRRAALAALEVGEADKERVRAAIAGKYAEELENAIVAQGGCAAAMHTEAEWSRHPLGSTTLLEPPISMEEKRSASHAPAPRTGDAPLSGVRVLDLTRVLAGPACTRFLAAWGAEVLRVDPPGFEEVPALVPDMTAGKRCCFLDIAANPAGFQELLRRAHVLVVGYRADALAKLDFSLERIREEHPHLLVARLNAYGWSGPLRNRRGFDSLVQMSTGIAARGMAWKNADRPTPLPAQALDHGAGYALAAGIACGLARLWFGGENNLVSSSLVGIANLLKDQFREPSSGTKSPNFAQVLVESETAWGNAFRAPSPGSISGKRGRWHELAGPLGRHPAEFLIGD